MKMKPIDGKGFVVFHHVYDCYGDVRYVPINVDKKTIEEFDRRYYENKERMHREFIEEGKRRRKIRIEVFGLHLRCELWGEEPVWKLGHKWAEDWYKDENLCLRKEDVEIILMSENEARAFVGDWIEDEEMTKEELNLVWKNVKFVEDEENE